MSKKINAYKEVSRALSSRKSFGRSKSADKSADRERANALARCGRDFDKSESLVKEHFYTRATFEKCVNEGARFVKWVRAETGRRVSFEDCRKFIDSYMNHRIQMFEQGKLSAGYLTTERAQLSKIYMVDLDYLKLPQRGTATKGRVPESYERWKLKNPGQARFYESVGARAFEYKFLAPDEARIYAGKCENATGYQIRVDEWGRVPNIQPFSVDSSGLIDKVVVVHGKHGKSRVSEILSENRAFVTECLMSGKAYEFFSPGSHVPTQAARREYAQALYRDSAKSFNDLRNEDMYRCRDGSGRVFDRNALERVSLSLGHAAGRYTTVTNNYLR